MGERGTAEEEEEKEEGEEEEEEEEEKDILFCPNVSRRGEEESQTAQCVRSVSISYMVVPTYYYYRRGTPTSPTNDPHHVLLLLFTWRCLPRVVGGGTVGCLVAADPSVAVAEPIKDSDLKAHLSCLLAGRVATAVLLRGR